MERRLVELRATVDGRTIRGGIPYNRESVLLGNFREVIAPGAFSRSIERNDVRAFWNHDPAQPIGRVANQTLRFADGPAALEFEIDLPDTQAGRDAHSLIRDGYVTQMSFGFMVPDKKQGERWSKAEDGVNLRTLLDVDLVEVSPVTMPAYPDTTVGLRALLGDEVQIPEQIPGEGRLESSSASVDSAVEAERALVQIRRRRLELLQRLGRISR